MTKSEELNLFLEKVNEFVESKYIVADIKIVNLLKTIAGSETLIAIFKNCLDKFDYVEAKKTYFVQKRYSAEDKGEFVLPKTSRELLALVFSILVDIDAKRINFTDFLNKYFYEDGSYVASYNSFINAMIKPFRDSVKVIMEYVLDGRLQDPIEAFNEAEQRRLKEREQAELESQKEKELSEKSYGEKIKKIKELLLIDKQNVKNSNRIQDEKDEFELVVNTLASVIDSGDKDAINYAYIAYKYVTKAHKFFFIKTRRKVNKLTKELLKEI